MHVYDSVNKFSVSSDDDNSTNLILFSCQDDKLSANFYLTTEDARAVAAAFLKHEARLAAVAARTDTIEELEPRLAPGGLIVVVPTQSTAGFID